MCFSKEAKCSLVSGNKYCIGRLKLTNLGLWKISRKGNLDDAVERTETEASSSNLVARYSHPIFAG